MAVFNDLLVKGPAKFLGRIDGNLTATSAEKLTTSAGSATKPIYFSDGKPVATTYTLGKSVPSDAVFTDTKVTQSVTTANAAFPLLLAPNGQTATNTTTSYFDSGVTLNPSTNTIAANISGNAATATKLATARTISLTGSVTGNGSFDGSGNLSIATTTNHSHSYLPLSGGTLTGLLTLTPSGSTTEGGEIRLSAPTGDATMNGLVIDSYKGTLRIFGTASADGTTKTGSGTVLEINPYDRTIASGGAAWYIYGIHSYARSASSNNFSVTTQYYSADALIYREYYRDSTDASTNARIGRLYIPGSTSKYFDVVSSTDSTTGTCNFIGTGITPYLKVGGNLVYHAGYKPHATGTASITATGSVTVNTGFQPSMAFVCSSVGVLFKAQTLTTTGFTFDNSEKLIAAGTMYWFAFR